MKKISILLILLLAGIAFGQQPDRWNGLINKARIDCVFDVFGF